MKDIGIVLYSFQNKDLVDLVEKNIENSSGLNNLFFYIIDQNNIDRKKILKSKYPNVKIYYKYVKWDSIKSPILHKQEGYRLFKKEYFLLIGDGVSLNKNWDEDLIKKIEFLSLEGECVLSGNHEIVPYLENPFIISYKKEPIFQETLTKYIDKDFIFTKSKSFLYNKLPGYLKYHGEKEHLSIYFNLIKIFALPTNFFKNETVELDKIEYLPFSIYHGYNEFVSKWSSSIKQLFGFEVLRLPFSTDDVLYDPSGSLTDKVGGERYLNFKGVIN